MLLRGEAATAVGRDGSIQYRDYVRPVWPTAPGRPQMMAHLDIAVEDLEAGVTWVFEQGANVADHQPQ